MYIITFFIISTATITQISSYPMLVITFSACDRGSGQNGKIIRNAVTDVDGNKYDAVKLGDQVWMQTNLRTKHYRDGSSIEQGTDNISAHDPLFSSWDRWVDYDSPLLLRLSANYNVAMSVRCVKD